MIYPNNNSNGGGTCGGANVPTDGTGWLYTETVKDHFFHPRNILIDEREYEADGIGIVGSPACGDMMALWIKRSEKHTS